MPRRLAWLISHQRAAFCGGNHWIIVSDLAEDVLLTSFPPLLLSPLFSEVWLMKTYLPKVDQDQRKWHVIDAEGAVLGRLAVKVADVLRGKNKPVFTPFSMMLVNRCNSLFFSCAKTGCSSAGMFEGLKVRKYSRMLWYLMMNSVRRSKKYVTAINGSFSLASSSSCSAAPASVMV